MTPETQKKIDEIIAISKTSEENQLKELARFIKPNHKKDFGVCKFCGIDSCSNDDLDSLCLWTLEQIPNLAFDLRDKFRGIEEIWMRAARDFFSTRKYDTRYDTIWATPLNLVWICIIAGLLKAESEGE